MLGSGGDMPVEQPLAVRLELMRYAAALVNPIAWPEPFGLVMAEALAAATPVLAFPNGAAPEIVEHGQTGYLCRSEEEMAAASPASARSAAGGAAPPPSGGFPWPGWPRATNGYTGPSWNARPGRRRGDGNRPPRRDPGYQGIAMRSHPCGPVLMMICTRGPRGRLGGWAGTRHGGCHLGAGRPARAVRRDGTWHRRADPRPRSRRER